MRTEGATIFSCGVFSNVGNLIIANRPQQGFHIRPFMGIRKTPKKIKGSAKRGARFSELTPRGSQEAGFTQPRAHLLADPCTIKRDSNEQ